MNHKPAVEFDEKYGTSISQEWKFPFDMMADDVWNLIKYRVEPQVKRFVDALTIEHFPYRDLDKLDYEEKSDILMGMCSGLNMDDILYFSVERVYGFMNREISDALDRMGLEHKWVVSQKTFEKIKEQVGK